ncbi:cytochrome P450 [Nocardia sp. SYP-A9097]|uniref:cytochrome P450 n=1 Tax=Nocardia sp. SYP-A9097 TaxID=2663237 RepID=UPI00129A9BE9|nr:cytochrome P450 [Nocardia sp. SYP-A9097]
MSPRYRLRWLLEQGSPRYALRLNARRGDPFARLVGSRAGLRDPYPYIEQIRERGRMYRGPIGWATADYELSRAILRDNRFGVFGMNGFELPAVAKRRIAAAPLPPNPVEAPSMLQLDPPEHTRMRKSVSAAFTPRAIGRLRDRVESVTVELLEALPSDGSADLIANFAGQVPIAIIAEMLGFPQESRPQFLEWGDAASPLLDIGISWKAWRIAAESMMQMDGYLDRHIAQLRAQPGEDILSSLVSAGNLDDNELKATASLLMGAGFETTVNLIGNGVVQLLAHPEQLARLHKEPELWPQAVEEVLRFDAPVQTTARIALCDTEIDGNKMHKGAVVVLSLAGANRDPKMFENPDRFDITRANAKDHLTFSSGIHTCLGASLARMEAIHALRSLFDRFPDLSLAQTPERRQLFTLHGYSRMPVNLGHRATAVV